MNIADRSAAARVATANTADLTVVGGAGHVGIPLVLSFAAKGLAVNINDINEQALATLKSGQVPFLENGAQPLLTKALAEKRLFFTSQPGEISTGVPMVTITGPLVDISPGWLVKNKRFSASALVSSGTDRKSVV